MPPNPCAKEHLDEMLSATIPMTTGRCSAELVSRAVDRTRFTLRSDEPLTVVVPTIGRWGALHQCLAAVTSQLRDVDELVVVVNAQDSGLVPVLPERARVLHEPRLGASWARNAGWQAARHQRVVFFDDDTSPDPACLDTMRAQLDQSDVVTGGVIGANTDQPVPRLFDTEFALHRGWLPRRYGGIATGPLAPRDTWRAGVGAVMAWNRSALETLGGFDPALGNGTPAGGAEDLDALSRAMGANFEVRYEPRALVWHWHPETRLDFERTIRSYQRALGAWGAKRLLESTGPLGVGDLAAQLRDAYRGAGRSLAGRSKLPALAQLAAGPDAMHGAIQFVLSRRASRQGAPVPAASVRGDRVRTLSPSNTEVDVAGPLPHEARAPRMGTDPERVILRNGPHPVAAVHLPPLTSVEDAVGAWARWVHTHPEGDW